LKSLTAIVGTLAVFMFIATATSAQAKEPKYLHALSDLRAARAWIESDQRPGFADQRYHAVEEIDHAIGEIKRAAWDDGKNLGDHPRPQSGGDPWAPLHSAAKLLEEARKDVMDGNDRRENQGLQDRALIHIDEAHHTLDRIFHEQR
jgi:hypothetical protein